MRKGHRADMETSIAELESVYTGLVWSLDFALSRALCAVSPKRRLTHWYVDRPPYSKADSCRRTRRCTDRQTEPGRRNRARRGQCIGLRMKVGYRGDLLSLCHPMIPSAINK